jgi:small conductance mechanosensitive channel
MLDARVAIAAVVVLAFALAAFAVRVLRSVLRRTIDAVDTMTPENRAAVHARAGRLVNAFSVLAYGIAAVVSVSLAVSRFGLGGRRIEQGLLVRAANIAVIVIVAFVVVRAAHLAIARLQYSVGQRDARHDPEWQRRAATLSGILSRVVTSVVAFLAILMLLRELSIDVLPILTGAGIAGLAIGFGAQNLVRDVISGFFLILEDQVRVGDLARINGVGGVVEQIGLRTIVLRDVEGAVQVFPNGTITSLANLSKQFAYAIVDLRVTYGENMDRVFGTIREVGAAIEHDAAWGPLVLAPLEIVGIESLADGFATIRVKLKTMPLNQGKVANELRRRIMTTFVGRGIRPYAG